MAHVLLIDDHADSQEVVAQLLRVHNHSVECCNDAESALAHLRQKRPDVVIADQRLPGMSGVEFIVRLRKIPELTDVPVILCSADDSPAAAARAAGALDFWLKGSEQLFNHVEQLEQSLSNSGKSEPRD